MDRVSRQGLYELVWSEPLGSLASRFGVSVTKFAKACRKHAIPVPHQGCWAKSRAGKLPTRPPLPARPLGATEMVEMGRKRWQYRGVSDKELLTMEPPPPPDFPEQLAELTERVRTLVGRVSIPKDLTKPHRLVAKLLEADDIRRREKSYFPRVLFDSPFEQRRLRVLSGLFNALDRLHKSPYYSGKDPEAFGVKVGDQHVAFTLDGCSQGHRSGYRSPEDLSRPASETLKLEISRHFRGMEGVPCLWQDNTGDRIERHGSEIIVALIVSGEMEYRLSEQRRHEWIIERIAKAIEDERLRTEREHRETLERKLQAENARVERLLGEAGAYRQAKEIRAYVETVQNASADLSADVQPDELREWASWAIAQADRIDPIRSKSFLRDHAWSDKPPRDA